MSAPYTIELEYPLYPEPRYGWGRPPHPKLVEILERGRAVYREHLSGFLDHESRLASVAKVAPDAEDIEPSWINGSLPGLDAVALYGMLRRYQPARYFEIGAGHSTKWAHRAIQDHSLSTTITAIDPFPKPYIQAICNELVDQPLERVELSVFDQLQANDILFVDNSHRVFMNSDATVVFLDILPRLKPGVLVEFHDIALPVDYPPQFADKHFSEQYVLAAYLLAGGSLFDVILPNAFCSLDRELSQVLNPLWRHPDLNGDRVFDLEQIARGDGGGQQGLIETFGSSFWVRIREPEVSSAVSAG